jgi:hypothetical protein
MGVMADRRNEEEGSNTKQGKGNSNVCVATQLCGHRYDSTCDANAFLDDKLPHGSIRLPAPAGARRGGGFVARFSILILFLVKLNRLPGLDLIPIGLYSASCPILPRALS